MDIPYLKAAQRCFDNAERMEPGSKAQRIALADAERFLIAAADMYLYLRGSNAIRYAATQNL